MEYNGKCVSYDAQSDITLNPWQNNGTGYETELLDDLNAEQIKLSSPLLYARIVKRNVDLESVRFNGLSEIDYLTSTGKLDNLYDEGDKQMITGSYRVYAAYEVPTWAQELGGFGTREEEEITLNFNIKTLTSNLDGSVLHIGDVFRTYDSIHGWKWYEIMNAVPAGQNFGQYLMWQVTAKKTDLEGYIDLQDDPDLNDHRDSETNTNPNIVDKPRPRIY